MMSIETIRALQHKAARDSQKRGILPYVIEANYDIDRMRPFPIPFIGLRVPTGWQKVKVCPSNDGAGRWTSRSEDERDWLMFLVDSSGFGSTGELALTQDQFVGALRWQFERHPEYGWAVVEVGQFQVVVAAFERTERKALKRAA